MIHSYMRLLRKFFQNKLRINLASVRLLLAKDYSLYSIGVQKVLNIDLYKYKYKPDLVKCGAPITPVFTTIKLRTCLSSLKPDIEMPLKNIVVYKINCPRCSSSYVGLTTRHIIRFQLTCYCM